MASMTSAPHSQLPSGRPPAQFYTERLLLRPFQEEDLEPFAAINADPRVTATLGSPLLRTESDALAARIQQGFVERGYGLWALEVPGQVPFIGFTGLAHPQFAAPFMPCVEIAWRLAAEHWGKGYATEAATAVLEAAFVHLKLAEVVSFTWISNHRSRRVMQRLGMTHDPAEDFDHPCLPRGHPLLRHVLYRKQSPHLPANVVPLR